jgi:hypothetical protein
MVVVDPLNRRCRVIDVTPETVTVRLAGSYGATVRYPPSCLTLEEEAE